MSFEQILHVLIGEIDAASVPTIDATLEELPTLETYLADHAADDLDVDEFIELAWY